jgi:ribosomal protein L11 methyltransferase
VISISNLKSEISTPKKWHLVAVSVSAEAEEAACSLLFELGATGIVTLEESGASIKLGAYFEEQAEVSEITRAIEAELARVSGRDALLAVELSDVPDQDWMRKWKEGFEAIMVGERLIIAPSWKLPYDRGDRLVIQIDPGMAFGTGTHETTRLCLEAIERYARGSEVLDVGTGTGILAIAAALVRPGARVTAIDVDTVAVEVARENVSINNVSASVELFQAQPRDFADRAFDTVLANLTAEVIIALMKDLAGCLAPAGVMILSGILAALRADVECSLTEAGLAVVDRSEAGEWAALVAVRGDR